MSPTQGWLSATPLTGTTPAQLTISADPSNLPAGTYSGQILASVGPLHYGAVTTVQFTVAATGSSAGGLAASPSSLTFSAQSTVPQTISVSNTGGAVGVIHFTAYATSTGWLAITTSDQATPGTITVQVYPAALSSGIYTGTITVTAVETGKSTVVPVTMVISQTGLGSSATLAPGQQNLTFNYQLNTASNPLQTVYVGTNSTQYLYFNATASDSWLGVASASWMTPAATATGFAPGLLYVAVDPTGLSEGTYNGTVTLSATGVSAVNVPVTLNVSSNTVLNANPSFISLDANLNLLNSNLAVTGSSNFYFTATVAAGASWLTVSPGVSITGTDATNLTVTADVTGLPGGTYNTSITLTGPGGQPTLTVPVQLKTQGPTVANALAVSPAEIDLTAIAGDPSPSAYLSVISTLAADQQFTAAAVSDGGWLSITPLSGSTPTWPQVAASTAIPAGSYSGSIVVTSLVTGDVSTITVKYTLTARALVATPSALVFTQQSVGAALAPQSVQVTANAPSSFRIVSQPAWVKIQPATGLTTPAKLVVTADPTGMAPGQYADNILLSGPNNAIIQVALTVAQPPPPTATPASINFTYGLGSPAPDSQTISVANPTGTAAFAVTTSTNSGVDWLAATPATGSTPGAVAVSVDVTKVVPGQDSGSVTISVNSDPAATLTVSVNLTVTGSPIQVQTVLNAATLAPTRLSPGEIVTITGIGLGPDTAVIGQPTSAGAFGTTLAGVQLLFDGIPAPLLYVQKGQINAIVPYAVYGRTSAQVQVQSGTTYSIPINLTVVDAAPGIFALGTLGSGQAAALNADFTVNSVTNPVDRGSVIMLYLTGEGQTDPPGQDGRVIMTDLRKPLLPVTALIGDQPAQVLYAGSSPTQVSGLCQVNLQIPAALSPGEQPVKVLIGGISSQAGVTIQVR